MVSTVTTKSKLDPALLFLVPLISGPLLMLAAKVTGSTAFAWCGLVLIALATIPFVTDAISDTTLHDRE